MRTPGIFLSQRTVLAHKFKSAHFLLFDLCPHWRGSNAYITPEQFQRSSEPIYIM